MKRLLIFAFGLMMISCRKDEEADAAIPAEHFLTASPWVLVSFGFDDNRNDKIDVDEESIEDCQKDNTWFYYPDGTGLFEENNLSCATGIDRQPFTWRLTDDKKTIDLFHDKLLIQQLNATELVLYKELRLADGDVLKLILSFRH
jgi:hypothetical protein